MRRRTVSQRLDATRPVNWDWPGNRGLVSEWAVTPFGFGSRTLYDLVRGAKKPNNGTLTNGPTWQGATRPGGCGAVVFDGTDDHVLMANGLTATAGYTVACWVRLDSAGDYPQMVTHSTNGGAGADLRFNASTGKAEFVVSNTNSGPLDSVNVAGSGWHHFVGTSDFSSALKLYRDGTLVASAAGTTNTGNQPFRLGARNDGFYLPGAMDAIRIYSRALSAAEVRNLYHESRMGYPNAWNWQRSTILTAPAAVAGGPWPFLMGESLSGMASLGL